MGPFMNAPKSAHRIAQLGRSAALMIAGWLGLTGAVGGTLSVDVAIRWKDQPVSLGARVASESGRPAFTVERFDTLLSNFAFQDSDGRRVPLNAQVAFVSAAGRNQFTLTQTPAGSFSALCFDVGVPENLNHADPASYGPNDPLNPVVNGLHWGWQGGYIFLALEGHWETKTGGPSGFSYHLATDRQRRSIEVPVTLILGENGQETVHLTCQLDRLFEGAHALTFSSATSSTHSRTHDDLANRLGENLSAAWVASSGARSSTSVGHEPNRPGFLMASDAPLYRFTMPKTFPQPALPRDNPLTEPGVELGRRLFHEPALSGNELQTCASCHQPEAAFSDPGRRFSIGAEGHAGQRNGMPLFNLAWQTNFFWDGRAQSLRQQVLAPIQNPLEMHANLSEVTERLSKTGYGPYFAAAFGTPEITSDRLARALEQYLLTLVSGSSKFDRAISGTGSFTAEESRGLQLFFTEYDPRHGQMGADCFHCHGGAFFSDFGFHNNGLDSPETATDTGRATVTGRESDRWKFKTPSLRHVAATGPYMHDGRFSTLEEVVDHYAAGVRRSPTLDPNLAKHPDGGVPMSIEDRHALVAFLKTLGDGR